MEVTNAAWTERGMPPIEKRPFLHGEVRDLYLAFHEKVHSAMKGFKRFQE
jgi:hypothetical protein